MNHSFDTKYAALFGVVEAVILQNLQHWILHNKANKTHQHDGRTWTYNSVRAYSDLFPYLTLNQVRRAIDHLVAAGVLVTGNYNSSPYDRTKWFAFNNESAFLEAPVDLSEKPNEFGSDAKTVNTDINTDINTDTWTVFEGAWEIYPKRSGGNSKADALKAWKARVKEGIDEAIMLAGTERYSIFCEKDGIVGTKFVKQAVTFFGPGLHFTELYTLPENRKQAGVSDKFKTSFDRTADIEFAKKNNAARGVPVYTDPNDPLEFC